MAPTRPRPNQARFPLIQAGSEASISTAAIDWTKLKPDICLYYSEQGQPLRKVKDVIQERHNIHVSEKQLKDKTKAWGIGKNLHTADIAPLIRLFNSADADVGRGKPVVMYKGRVMPRTRLAAYLKRQKISENDVLSDANPNQATPTHMKLEYSSTEVPPGDILSFTHEYAMTPPVLKSPSGTSTSPSFGSHPSTGFPTPFPALQARRQLPLSSSQEALETPNLHVEHQEPFGHASQSGLPAVQLESPASIVTLDTWVPLDISASLNSVINQIWGPDTKPGSITNGLNVWRVLSGSQQVSSQQDLIHNLGLEGEASDHVPEDLIGRKCAVNMPQNFLKSFFGACMLRSQGSLKEAEKALRWAKELLGAMVRDHHPECLTALNVMLSVLEAHGEKDLAGDFLGTVLVLTPPSLGDNPVAEAAEFMIKVATRKLNAVDHDIRHLRAIHQQLQDEFGLQSASALVGLYHVAWRHAAVKEHRDFALSEMHRKTALSILTELVPSAAKVLGPSHFLTIACTITMARVLPTTRSNAESVELMKKALREIDSSYATFHPYRLEARYRLALFLIDDGRKEEAAIVLDEVVWKRFTVLGRNNSLTQKSLKELHTTLVETGTPNELEKLESDFLSRLEASEACEDLSLDAYLPMVPPTPAFRNQGSELAV